MMPINGRNLFWCGLLVGMLSTVVFLDFLPAVVRWSRAPVSPLVKYQVCDQLGDIGANFTHVLDAMSTERKNGFLHNVMQLEPQVDALKNILLTVYALHNTGHRRGAIQMQMRVDCNQKMGDVWKTLE